MEKRLLKACSDAALSALKESSKTVKPKAFRKSAAPSAYILFTKAKRPELKGSSPDLKPTEVMRALAQLWKQTTESERAPFIEEASQLKAAAAGLEPEQRSMSEESASFTIKGQDTSKVSANVTPLAVGAAQPSPTCRLPRWRAFATPPAASPITQPSPPTRGMAKQPANPEIQNPA
uniref:HMG box domain-containing protein n=1 Tax=Haptolina ericina TaxID=156174 RepID=A0A7S3BCH5_9EUKA|mmetsp:Transcript_56789/g.126823  ORF Transcript_56789/g.126823 Transcript_56789/m.126823 type:complete len:177 (+) Transcript_56789:40-570(+)